MNNNDSVSQRKGMEGTERITHVGVGTSIRLELLKFTSLNATFYQTYNTPFARRHTIRSMDRGCINASVCV
jgi:hypothetical protein